MTTNTVTLDVIQVASPCSASWDEMAGDDRARFCGQCRLNVYNLSEMTRAEATAFVQNREGRTCIRFYRRTDGTVITRDCPVGLRALRRRVARMAAAVVALCGAIMASTVFAWTNSVSGRRAAPASPTAASPKTKFLQWLSPPQQTNIVMGGCPPPPTGSISGPNVLLGKLAAPEESQP